MEIRGILVAICPYDRHMEEFVACFKDRGPDLLPVKAPIYLGNVGLVPDMVAWPHQCGKCGRWHIVRKSVSNKRELEKENHRREIDPYGGSGFNPPRPKYHYWSCSIEDFTKEILETEPLPSVVQHVRDTLAAQGFEIEGLEQAPRDSAAAPLPAGP